MANEVQPKVSADDVARIMRGLEMAVASARRAQSSKTVLPFMADQLKKEVAQLEELRGRVSLWKVA